MRTIDLRHYQIAGRKKELGSWADTWLSGVRAVRDLDVLMIERGKP
jgi:hypothetical protein